ncbi:MAG: hypothetical protein HGA53_08345, partial [Anaerolineaceae bacterium]|nr:hypothetical protein [Anaerolineaceae bacterium]
LTHFHPDHVSGMPPLLMGMWLLGRKKPLLIHGLRSTMEKAETMMSLYEWKSWPNFFPVQFHTVEESELQLLLENQDMKIVSTPVRHLIPTIGLRIEIKSSHKTIAYSCDTEPFDGVVTLAEGADLLIHEAAGKGKGHSSPAQAGEIAQRAEVSSLMLIHYAPAPPEAQIIAEARSSFQGDIKVAKDWMTLDF